MTYTEGEVLLQQHRGAQARVSTELVEFLWHNHSDLLFSAHPTKFRTSPMPYTEALGGLRSSGWKFFAPVPRITRGNRKRDCARSFDALWVDIDDEPGVDPYALLDEVKANLPSTLYPSAVVSTGNKGIHCFWKLETLLPIEEIEGWNRVLIRRLDGDPSCPDRTRFLAHPGTPHRDTGRLVEIIEFSATLHPVESLVDLGDLPHVEQKAPRQPRRTGAGVMGGKEAWLEAAEAIKGWGNPKDLSLGRLLGTQWGYLRTPKSKKWKQAEKSRSEVEAAIVSRFVEEGASDEQIVNLADSCFWKHLEESQRYGDRYIERTIRSARRDWFEKGWITHPLGGQKRKRDATYRKRSVEELQDYFNLVQGQRLAEWVSEVCKLGPSRSSAYEYKDGLVAEELAVVRAGRIYKHPVTEGTL